MTTPQIISLLVLLSISIFLLIKIIIYKGFKKSVIVEYAIGLVFVNLFTLAILLLAILDNNSKKSPCPQYKKIENAYQLKQ